MIPYLLNTPANGYHGYTAVWGHYFHDGVTAQEAIWNVVLFRLFRDRLYWVYQRMACW